MQRRVGKARMAQSLKFKIAAESTTKFDGGENAHFDDLRPRACRACTINASVYGVGSSADILSRRRMNWYVAGASPK